MTLQSLFQTIRNSESTTHTASQERVTAQISAGFVCLLGILLVVLLAPLIFFPFQTDQAHFAYLSFLWSQGYTLYTETQTHQWPGQFLLYLWLFQCIGTSEWVIRSFDFVLHWLASITFFFLVARLSTPFWGVVASVGFAIGYVSLGDWNTSNRETYQIAFFLPILWWLLFSSFSERTEKIIAFFGGVLTAFSLSIKPTSGLLLFVFIAMIWFPISPLKKVHRKGILLSFLAGIVCCSFSILAPFYKHLPAIYESLILFNLNVYSKIAISINQKSLSGLAAFAHRLAFTSFYLSFIVLFFASKTNRNFLIFLFFAHLACLLAVFAQTKGFAYHKSLLAPFSLLWPILLLAKSISFVQKQRQQHHYLLSFLGAVIFCLVLFSHWFEIYSTIKRYTLQYDAIFEKRTQTQYVRNANASQLPVIWEASSSWIKKNVKAEESVFIYGLHDGLQFKAKTKPLSRVTRGVLAYWQADLNRQPIVQKQMQQWISELKSNVPDWFLVAVYDATWISRSALKSLPKLPELKQFIQQHYVLSGAILLPVQQRANSMDDLVNPNYVVCYIVYKRQKTGTKP